MDNTPGSPRFPVEIHDLVIDELFDFRPALRACLSVSRSFRHRARGYIFSEIKLNYGISYMDTTAEENHRRLKLLVDLMRPPASGECNSPCSILPFIRRFDFAFQVTSNALYGHRYSSTTIDDELSRSENQILSQTRDYTIDILQMLGTVCSSSDAFRFLTIRHQGYTLVHWDALGPALRSGLLYLIRATPSLTLMFEYVDIIPMHILRGTTVRHVIMDSAYIVHHGFAPHHDSAPMNSDPELFPEYDENSGIALLPLPALEKATLKSGFQVFLDAIYPLEDEQHPHLSMRELHIVLKEFEDIQLLNRVSKEYPNLEVLSVVTEVWSLKLFNADTSGFDLRDMTSLKQIDLSIQPAYYSDSDQPDARYNLFWVSPCMLSILNSCANPCVSTISFRFPTTFIAFKEDGSYNIDLGHFHNLDICLSDFSKFPSLQSCKVNLSFKAQVQRGFMVSDDFLEVHRNRLVAFVRCRFFRVISSNVAFAVEISFV